MVERRNTDLSEESTLTDSGRRRAATDSPTVLAPHLFVALECDRPEAGVARYSLANMDRVWVGRGPVRCCVRSFEAGQQMLAIRIPDAHMSSRHACLLRDGAGLAIEDLGSHNGTRVDGIPLSKPARLADGTLIEAGHTIFWYRAAVPVPVGEPADVNSVEDDATRALVTIDPSLARRAAALGRVARSTAPVLLLGETGTGKELLARAIHRLSQRKGPFVAVNCGALPMALVEAQLFGHVRGAFSGAVADAPGLLRSADGGTLLLDEIGDLPEPSQAALLRALQEREVVPVGGVRAVKTDLRVVAATHQPLEKLVEAGKFRKDLYARIAGFCFSLPPLRERREDIGLLVGAFARERQIQLTPAAASALLRHPWPLNVRELHQALDVAATLADGEVIDVADLPPAVAQSRSFSVSEPPEPVCAEELQRRLVASLGRHRGNVSKVARELGKARTQVQRWMKRFGLEARSFRRP